LVLRDDDGWCITEAGRQFLATLEAPVLRAQEDHYTHALGPMIADPPDRLQPILRLVVDNTLASQSGLGPNGTRRSA
jgi:hypothetical protein